MRAYTQKHYIRIAATLKSERPGANWDANKRVQWNLIVKAFVDSFKHDSEKFKDHLFIAACGDYFDFDIVN